MHDDQPTRLLDAAVRNNALWCDAVCRAHGQPTEMGDALWLCRGTPPPFYPHAVTLQAEAAAVLAALADGGVAAGWTIKDSYAALALAPLGFRPLFDASWIGLDAEQARAIGSAAGLRWAPIGTETDLDAWEAAWRGVPTGANHDEGPRTFREALLTEDGVRFLAGYRGTAIVAGAIANRTGDVVGLSNVFLPEDAALAVRGACFGAVAAQFPGLPLVGYERGADLDAALALGCTVLGPLRIWSYAPA